MLVQAKAEAGNMATLLLDGANDLIQTPHTLNFMGDNMKKILIVGLAFAVTGFTGMAFAKSRSTSHGSTSSKNHDSSSSQNHDASGKQSSDTPAEKQSQHNNKIKKTHHCKLANGKADTSKTQPECLKVNGKWVKY
jgi:hypothetical protein